MSRRYCKDCATYHSDEALCPSVVTATTEAKDAANSLRAMLHGLTSIRVDAGSGDPLEDISTAEGAIGRLYRHYKAKAGGAK